MQNKTVAIFGGSGGLGSQLTEMFKQNRIYNDEYKKNRNYNAYKIISLSSKDVDVSYSQSVINWFEDNNPDIIVYASAINRDGLISKQEYKNIWDMIDINVGGLSCVLHESMKQMKEKGWGRFIAFSSILSQKPLMGTGLYAASKSYMDTLVKTAAIENAKYGVTCNSIRLGYFDGGLTYKVPEKILEQAIQNIPLKRLGTIEELYKTVMFLIETEYMNGATLSLDGGLSV